MQPPKLVDGEQIEPDMLPAPGELDLVRRFLNTEQLADYSRGRAAGTVDELPELLRDRSGWAAAFPEAEPGPGDTIERLAAVRADLRALVGAERDAAARLNRWLTELPLALRAIPVGDDLALEYVPVHGAHFAGRLLAVVVRAIAEGSWSRLKACPDCGWVFYDYTRSKTKRWCRMLAGQDGRGCGTIAKVRRYRQKRRRQPVAGSGAGTPA